jgi:hypothetical protein
MRRRRHDHRPEYSHIAFSEPAAGFDNAAAQIRSSGARIWKENESEGPSLYFLDPDGHKLEIHIGDWRTRLGAMKKDPWEENIKFFDLSDPSTSLSSRRGSV